MYWVKQLTNDALISSTPLLQLEEAFRSEAAALNAADAAQQAAKAAAREARHRHA